MPAQAVPPNLHWQQVYPYPSGHPLKSATWGSPGFVIVGFDRELIFSPDGYRWQRVAPLAPKDAWLESVCYAYGHYVVAGFGGLILSSTDGYHWQSCDTGSDGWFRTCTSGDGKYVVGGWTDHILASTNALTWERFSTPEHFSDITFGSNQWVAVSRGHIIYSSIDLQTWTAVSAGDLFPGPALSTICYAAGRYVAAGSWGFTGSAPVILYSDDGIDWQMSSLGGLDVWGEITDTSYVNGWFYAIGSQLIRSTNGISWEQVPNAPSGQTLASSSSGTLVVAGDDGSIFTSSDAQAWQTITDSPRVYIQSAAWAQERFVAVGGSPYYIGGPVGNAAVFTSTNADNWQAFLTDREDQLSAVAFGNNVWIVTGDNGGIFTSSNGVDWVDHSLPPTSHDLYRLVFGNGRFLAFADGRDLIYHSTNGVDWQTIEVPNASSARFVNGRFMAPGGTNTLFSEDGLTWDVTATPTAEGINAFCYGKGRYVGGGYFSLSHSLDGTNWTSQPAPMQVYDIQYIEGWFIAVGNAFGLMISRDGISWDAIDDPALNEFALNTIAYGSGTLLAGGGLSLYRGILFETEPFRKQVHFLAPQHLEYYGESGKTYRLEESADLVNWTAVSDWKPGAKDYLIWDTGSFQHKRSFWRIALKQ